MKIDFSKLDYKFTKKPLLVGGKAMEYYGLRKAGDDIDFIASKEDVEALIQKYPKFVKDLWGDFGLKVYGLEIWKTIDYLYYEDYIGSAIEEDNYFVKELYWGKFSRTLSLPAEVEPEEVEATERHGLLTIKIKKVDKEKKNTVKIKSI